MFGKEKGVSSILVVKEHTSHACDAIGSRIGSVSSLFVLFLITIEAIATDTSSFFFTHVVAITNVLITTDGQTGSNIAFSTLMVNISLHCSNVGRLVIIDENLLHVFQVATERIEESLGLQVFGSGTDR